MHWWRCMSVDSCMYVWSAPLHEWRWRNIALCSCHATLVAKIVDNFTAKCPISTCVAAVFLQHTMFPIAQMLLVWAKVKLKIKFCSFLYFLCYCTIIVHVLHNLINNNNNNLICIAPVCAKKTCLCKSVERIINGRVVWYLEKNNLITNIQSGFCKSHNSGSRSENPVVAARPAQLRGLESKHR